MKTLSHIVLLPCVVFATLFSNVVSQSNSTNVMVNSSSSVIIAPNASVSTGFKSYIVSQMNASTINNGAGGATSAAVKPTSTTQDAWTASTTQDAWTASNTQDAWTASNTQDAWTASNTQNAGVVSQTASLTSLPKNTASPNVQQSGASWSSVATQSKNAQTSEPQPEPSSHAAANTNNIMPSKSEEAQASVSANELSCYQCSYNQTGYCKKKTKNCEVDAIYCFDFNYKYRNGSQWIGKDCVTADYCSKSNTEEACQRHNDTQAGTLKECGIDCCQSELCNSNFPSDKASSVSLQFACWLIILAPLFFAT